MTLAKCTSFWNASIDSTWIVKVVSIGHLISLPRKPSPFPFHCFYSEFFDMLNYPFWSKICSYVWPHANFRLVKIFVDANIHVRLHLKRVAAEKVPNWIQIHAWSHSDSYGSWNSARNNGLQLTITSRHLPWFQIEACCVIPPLYFAYSCILESTIMWTIRIFAHLIRISTAKIIKFKPNFILQRVVFISMRFHYYYFYFNSRYYYDTYYIITYIMYSCHSQRYCWILWPVNKIQIDSNG